MADRPIIFSAPMVKALIDGRKTMTRRVLKPQPVPCLSWSDPPSGTYPSAAGWSRLPYAPGDRLWVREAWRSASCYDDLAPSAMGGEEPIRYEADALWQTWGWGVPLRNHGRLRQGIHMPRWASRLTLTVTDVRVQRLQDISESDAAAEGIECAEGYWTRQLAHIGLDEGDLIPNAPPVPSFASLWNTIHGPEAWDANPWCAAISFTVQQGNIDT